MGIAEYYSKSWALKSQFLVANWYWVVPVVIVLLVLRWYIGRNN